MKKLSKNPPNIIKGMFSSIAHRYDLLNSMLSFGRDRYWRHFAVSQIPDNNRGIFLDLATGTGDIAIEIVRQHPSSIKVIGIDFSERMLELGRKKIRKMGYQNQIELNLGDITSLPYKDETFDAAIIAFGIRNLHDYRDGLKEIRRVLREGGSLVILEFTSLQEGLFKLLFHIYLRRFLPLIGGMISGRRNAYEYLSNSVLDFPGPEELKQIMEDSGFRRVRFYRLTFSVVTVHVGIK
jgi:demethylmenaquinone methyltransferase/2-methoxy-6-polyprenyl-1,4-benzoquinol methylase